MTTGRRIEQEITEITETDDGRSVPSVYSCSNVFPSFPEIERWAVHNRRSRFQQWRGQMTMDRITMRRPAATSRAFPERTTKDEPTDGRAIPRMKDWQFIFDLHGQCIRGIAPCRTDGASVGINFFQGKRRTGKQIWDRKLNHREFARRSRERRFFCPLIFLPFLWLRPKAAMVNRDSKRSACHASETRSSPDIPGKIGLRRRSGMSCESRLNDSN
jgi:hypothetical protein